ncbi:MAG: chemotaxis protein CheX [Chitinispirillales bacterium]|jgi:CheY-specific phosphatase CheX|nr:chemotaxis protein CheX [Chitinispirillales bacterium]
MYSETLGILDGVCKLVLEELAFLFCDSNDASSVDLNQMKDTKCVSMSFMGPTNGRLEIAAGQDLCLILAANMLGAEPDEEEAANHAVDALKEALNVVCGRFLTETFGEEAVFNLSAPVSEPAEELSKVHETAVSEGMLFFEAEGHFMVVKITICK